MLSLSSLQKYDNKPVIVCLITPLENILYLINTTFLIKISHSSQDLRVDNIKGSFNGSDIMRYFENIKNAPENFEELYSIHENYTFNENLERLVETTNDIQPTGQKFYPTVQEKAIIYDSINRAKAFITANDYSVLNRELDDKVKIVSKEIIIASLIDNVNLRGENYRILNNRNRIIT